MKKKYHINLDKYKKIWYDNVAKEKCDSPLLVLLSLKEKEEVLRFRDMMDDWIVKEAIDKIMQLNKALINSFWGLTPEEDERKLQNSREYRIRKESEAIGETRGQAIGQAQGKVIGKAEGKAESLLEVAKNMLKENYSLAQISKITKLSESKIKTLL